MSQDMARYSCVVCSYGYHPMKGDPIGGIPPGTPFEDLPDDWRCPWCGVSKSQFVPEKQEQNDVCRRSP